MNRARSLVHVLSQMHTMCASRDSNSPLTEFVQARLQVSLCSYRSTSLFSGCPAPTTVAEPNWDASPTPSSCRFSLKTSCIEGSYARISVGTGSQQEPANEAIIKESSPRHERRWLNVVLAKHFKNIKQQSQVYPRSLVEMALPAKQFKQAKLC